MKGREGKEDRKWKERIRKEKREVNGRRGEGM